jgi:hypothetical protein
LKGSNHQDACLCQSGAIIAEDAQWGSLRKGMLFMLEAAMAAILLVSFLFTWWTKISTTTSIAENGCSYKAE